ncbi:MAG: hypothetical protein O7D86_03940 [Proteobacteria bacterium]|nr:hypothetical protein [Pseudomonadota bacterium]
MSSLVIRTPWLALYLDLSLPMSYFAKAAMLLGHRSFSRRVILPLIKPFARLSIVLVQLLRFILPSSVQSPRILHLAIYWSLKTFASKETNSLILRHMHIGTQILRFIASNTPDIEITTTQPLRPENLKGLIDNTFTIHDLNLFNFVIELNRQLREQGRELEPVENIDFSEIRPEIIILDDLPDTWHNVLDIQTAIELYTPLYALFQSDEDFRRACNSLQLDETIAIYICTICNTQIPLSIVNNGHPTVPISTLGSGYRLMLHGLDAENLYGFLIKLKEAKKSLDQNNKN